MDIEAVRSELDKIASEYGDNPFSFFWLLKVSENPNLDFDTQNKEWAFVKSESWHGLTLDTHYLWAISDNGDLLWWNGEQTIAMNSRDMEFHSTPVRPTTFMRKVAAGQLFGMFPDQRGTASTPAG